MKRILLKLLPIFILSITINAVGQNKQIVEKHLRKGMSVTREKSYTEAINSFTKAIELNPNNPESYYLRGVVFSKKKQYQDALNDYEKSLELSPDYF